jgi:hypothetical protein
LAAASTVTIRSSFPIGGQGVGQACHQVHAARGLARGEDLVDAVVDDPLHRAHGLALEGALAQRAPPLVVGLVGHADPLADRPLEFPDAVEPEVGLRLVGVSLPGAIAFQQLPAVLVGHRDPAQPLDVVQGVAFPDPRVFRERVLVEAGLDEGVERISRGGRGAAVRHDFPSCAGPLGLGLFDRSGQVGEGRAVDLGVLGPSGRLGQ